MTAAPAVQLRDVWRRYRRPSAHRPVGLRASLGRDPLRRARDSWSWALRGVDLDVDPGESVAVIGRNGAGKSTLLRLVGGIGAAERGSVDVRGRIGALTDLGHELHPDLTGRQNAELAAVVAGLSRREFRDRSDEIFDFAELDAFADEPLRAYSDGMQARLAFSVMAHVDPEVLLVDEVLAVGDAPFQRRSIARIAELRARGAAVLFVSHDLALVREVCERAVWLDLGVVRAGGPSADVVAEYSEATAAIEDHPVARTELLAVRVEDPWGLAVSELRPGQGLQVRVTAATHPGGVLRVRLLRAPSGVAVVDTSAPIRPHDEGLVVCFERLDLAPGDHDVEVTLFRPDWSAVLDQAPTVRVAVRGDGPDTAVLAPPHVWRREA